MTRYLCEAAGLDHSGRKDLLDEFDDAVAVELAFVLASATSANGAEQLCGSAGECTK
jgi:hypothetical protein